MSGPRRAGAVRRAGENLGRRSQPRGVVVTPSHRHCLVNCGTSHEAEDLLQSALVTACVRWGSIRDKGAADPYVRRTMLNRRRGALRRGRGRCGGTTTELASPAPAEAATSQAAGVAAPLSYLSDGRLHVLDPQGVDHELGLDVEAVLGSTESATSAGSTPSTATRVREPGPGLPGRRPGAPPRWRAGGRADRHRRLPMGVDSEPRAGGRGARQRLPLALRRPGRLARTASRRCGTGTAVDALRRGRRACEVGGRPSCRRLSVEGEDLTLAR